MDFHLTRSLRLHTKPEHKNLYKWAINEIDGKGHQIGRDQIPWHWSLNFTATSCPLSDSIDIEAKTAPEPTEIAQCQLIQVRLRPGGPTTFSMFGTERAIQDFQLDIRPIADPTKRDEDEGRTAWGSVSYTAEDADLIDEMTEDCIVFNMFVKADTFSRYAAKIAHGLVDEISLNVKSVAGFYSEWSPSSSTRHVKVLTSGDEQTVTLPPGLQFEPPRLGDVGGVKLYVNRRLEFTNLKGPDEETADVGTVRVAPETRAPAVSEPRTLQMLGSLRWA